MTYLTKPKTIVYFSTDTDATLGLYRENNQLGSVAFEYNISIPDDFISLFSAEVMINIPAGAASSGRDVDIFSQYHTPGSTDVYNENSESDTTSTYDWSGYNDRTYMLDISNILSGITAGCLVGVQVKNNAVGATTKTFGIKLKYFWE